jgi:hypothetical protein
MTDTITVALIIGDPSAEELLLNEACLTQRRR